MNKETPDSCFEDFKKRFEKYMFYNYNSHMKHAKNKSHVFWRLYTLSNSLPLLMRVNRTISVILSYIEEKYILGEASLETILLDLRKDNKKGVKLSNPISILFIVWNKDYLQADPAADDQVGVVNLTEFTDQKIIYEFAKFKSWQKMHVKLTRQRKLYLDDDGHELTDEEMDAVKKNVSEEEDISFLENNWNEIRRKKEVEMGFTLARRVTAMVYIFNQMKIKEAASDTSIARFIEFLTGMSYDSIYKLVNGLYKRETTSTIKDLKFIKPFFEDLGWVNVVDKIDKEIKEILKEESLKK